MIKQRYLLRIKKKKIGSVARIVRRGLCRYMRNIPLSPFPHVILHVLSPELDGVFPRGGLIILLLLRPCEAGWLAGKGMRGQP